MKLYINKIVPFILTLYVGFTCTKAAAENTINSGRPGQACGSDILKPGQFQIQTGIDTYQVEQTTTRTDIQASNNVIRLGVSENLELNSLIEYGHLSSPGVEKSGISQLQPGFRFKVLDTYPDRWYPSLSFQARFQLKQMSHHFRNEQIAPYLLVSSQKAITKQFNGTINLGLSYDGLTSTPIYSYVLSLSQSLNNKWTTTYEAYGNEYSELRKNYLGVGIAYLANPDLQWDAYASSGRNEGIKELYVTVGCSWRFQAY